MKGLFLISYSHLSRETQDKCWHKQNTENLSGEHIELHFERVGESRNPSCFFFLPAMI